MSSIFEVTLPQLAESQVSAVIERWYKQPGDYIEVYEPICEVNTDKVTAEIPSTVAGKLAKILVGQGEEAPVGAIICVIEIEDSVDSIAATQDYEVANGQEVQASSQQTQATSITAVASTSEGRSVQRASGRFSPVVQQLAYEYNIDLQQVTGTGLEGRITRKDVLQFIANKQQQTPTAQPSTSSTYSLEKQSQIVNTPVRASGIHLTEPPKVPTIEIDNSYGQSRGETYIDVTPIRNTIARNMRQSVSEIPHAWTMIEVDVTNLVLLRNKYKDEFKKREGVNLTYLAFMLKAVVNAIRDYPIMNSVWAVDKIIVKRDINVSLAVGTEDSVMTPVIKNADHKNVAGLAKEIEELARKTREGKLTLSDMQGGTITVNNTGSFGSILSYPIINYPQAAILTFESIVKKPVVIHDMIAVRSMANICLSLDHRILDGVICGRFLQRVKENLESYNLESSIY